MIGPYLEAFPVSNPQVPTILLLHSFPASSFQYMNLITKFASEYRVLSLLISAHPTLLSDMFLRFPRLLIHGCIINACDNIAKTIRRIYYTLKLEKFAIYDDSTYIIMAPLV